MIDLDQIRRDNPLPEVAGKLVVLRSAGNEWVARCPLHADRSPSFTIFDNGRRFHCFGCNASGDVLDLVQRAYGVTLQEAARMLGAGDVPKARLPRLTPTDKTDNTAHARAIWDRAGPVNGTVAEAYLQWRGIAPPFPQDLRFLGLPYPDHGRLPCLVCAVRNVSGEVVGIQRIWLADDGQGKADVEKPKLSLGSIKGGAIRLGDLDDTGCVTVCEGPEDGLSLALMLGGPVWVAAGSSFLPAMQFPPGINSILIGADNDAAGREAAEKAARTYATRGLNVRILRPLQGFKDFNDELRSAGHGH